MMWPKASRLSNSSAELCFIFLAVTSTVWHSTHEQVAVIEPEGAAVTLRLGLVVQLLLLPVPLSDGEAPELRDALLDGVLVPITVLAAVSANKSRSCCGKVIISGATV